MKNPLIAFLASYGPQASSNNLYDEFVVEAAQKTNCTPLTISQPIVDELAEMFRSDSPRSVILTGTAGDGKTYTARKLVGLLSETDKIWKNTEKIFDIPLPGDSTRRIRFIKDLSELNESNKDEHFAAIRDSLTGIPGDLFVICVNDGHLLKFFRDRAAEGGKALHDMMARMLQTEQRRDEQGHFELINMSRQTQQSLVDDVIDAVVEHPDWARCQGCSDGGNEAALCPILVNRDLLARRKPGSLRARLKDLIRMAAADGRHLSIRQLILLASNILLGDSIGTTPLLSCKKARNRASKGEYFATNPYANAFGENLKMKDRNQYGAFSVLRDFGIGYETNNFFDHTLLWGGNALPEDPLYGSRVFDSLRQAYTQNPAEHALQFRRGMIEQRRRIFFSLDPHAAQVAAEARRDPWNLSLFRHGAEYIALTDALDSGKGPEAIAPKILRGLNRMMTGEMTSTERSLWLTEPSGVYLGQEIPLLVAEAGREKDRMEACLRFTKARGGSAPPVMRLWPIGRIDLQEELVLRPTIFECLMRVANGSLPASFSSECRQDIARFQLRASAAMRKVGPTLPRQIEINNGALQSKPIGSMVDPNGGW